MGTIDTAAGPLPAPPDPAWSPAPLSPAPEVPIFEGAEALAPDLRSAAQTFDPSNPAAADELGALHTLDTRWDDIRGGDDIVSEQDLRAIAGWDDPDLARAAQFYLDHPDRFAALDTASRGGGGDTKVSSADVARRQEQLDPDYTEADALEGLIGSWDSLNGLDGIVSQNDLRSTARFDTDAGRAARFYLDNPDRFAALDTAAKGGDTDSKVSINDIRARQDQLGIDPGLQQVSSHNSYEHGDSITEQFEDHGVQSFELDIHDSKADDGDWSVRHFGFEGSEGALSDYLDEISGLDADGPITLFIDLKGNPLDSADRSPADLDKMLKDTFGDRLFTTDDLIARAQDIDPNVSTVAEAVQVAGWPSEAELDGRVIVSLTGGDDGLGAYAGAERPNGSGPTGFIAPGPKFEDGEFVPNPDAGIYNINANPYTPDLFGTERDTAATETQAVTAEGFLVRNYGVDGNNLDQVVASGANFIGTDHYDAISIE